MQPKRKWILFLIFLGIPTLTIGGAAVFLLGNEHDRQVNFYIANTEFKANALAGQVASAIEFAQIEVLTGINLGGQDGQGSSSPDLFQELSALEYLIRLRDTNPMIRNVFVWQPHTGLQTNPDPTRTTVEEKRFERRYESLFSTDGNWRDYPALESGTKITTSRNTAIKNTLGRDFGWKVWHWEDQFSWLGWMEMPAGRGVIGVELETVYVLSLAITALQLPPEELTSYQLIDHRGVTFYQTRAPIEDADTNVKVTIGPVLPGWEIVALVPLDGVGPARLVFGWPAILVLVLLMSAILLSGWVFLRQADRNYRDALQKTNFVASVSHELKTPLTSISMYAEMLQSHRVTNESKRAEYTDVIVSQTKRLTRLVNNVLTFGRLEQGKGKYDCKALELAETLEAILATQAPRLEKRGIALATQLTPVTVWADRDAVEQVVLNLVDNAVKYGCPEDGKAAIEIRVAGDRHFGEVWILDKGPGVAPKWRNAIFKTFVRADNSLTRQKGGSGIGLSIAKLLVSDMGGDLIYKSETGYGACFVVSLPKYGGDA